MTTNERTVGRYLCWLLAALSAGAAFIHFAVSGEHYDLSWLHGSFFATGHSHGSTAGGHTNSDAAAAGVHTHSDAAAAGGHSHGAIVSNAPTGNTPCEQSGPPASAGQISSAGGHGHRGPVQWQNIADRATRD